MNCELNEKVIELEGLKRELTQKNNLNDREIESNSKEL
jgi:hypothetical protein